MINDRAEQFVHEKEAAHLRRLAITQLCLWGWEPVENAGAGPVEVRLLQRGELRCISKNVAGTSWDMWPIGADMLWGWQPCEWARFSTWTLRYAVRLIGE